MKNHISLFIFAIALLSGPVSANDLSMTAVKDTLASIPGEHNYIYVRTPLGLCRYGMKHIFRNWYKD